MSFKSYDVILNKGEAILPYAKQFLTPVKPFFGNSKNMGDRIDYGQRRNDDIGGQVKEYF